MTPAIPQKPNSTDLNGRRHLLSEVPFLSEKIQSECLAAGRRLRLSRNTPLFSQGDQATHFYLLLQGALKLTKVLENSSPAQQALVDIVGPNELVGALLMLDPQPKRYPVTAKPLGTVEVLQLSKEFFQNIWSKDSDLMSFTHQHIGQKIEGLQKDRCLQRFSLEKKVAFIFTEKIAGIKNLRITRQDIADCVGATQESVIRLLSLWAKDQLISTVNQEIVIHDLDRMKAIWSHP